LAHTGLGDDAAQRRRGRADGRRSGAGGRLHDRQLAGGDVPVQLPGVGLADRDHGRHLGRGLVPAGAPAALCRLPSRPRPDPGRLTPGTTTSERSDPPDHQNLPNDRTIPTERIPPMATYTLETNGAVCPFPLIDAKQAIAQLQGGDDLVIDFDCTQATEALPQWAAEDGHDVVNFDRSGDAGWTITVRKGA